MKRLLMALVVSAGIAGAVAPAAAQVYGNVNVRLGPPAPLVERVPVSPGPRYYWAPGAWRWSGSAYAWAPGSYVVRPYAGARYVAGHWVHRPRGWVWRAGHWI